MSSEWAKFTIFEHEGLCFQPIDVPGDGNCFYHALALSPLLPTNEMLQIREMICQFALGLGRFAAEDIVRLLHTFVALGPSSLVDVIATMRRPGSWATNIDIVLASLYFNVDIVCFSNLSPTIEVFRTSTFLENHLPNYNLSSPVSLFIFHHQYLRPLSPTTEAHRHRLNHYCLLQPLVQHAGRQIAPISNSPDASAAPICTTRKSFVQSSGLQWFQKPTSTASKKKGVSKSKSREKSVKLKKPKTMTAVAAANHAKNLAVVMKWSNLMGINQEEAAKHDAARMLELKRRKDRADCLINCHEFAVIELLLSSMIDRVEAILDDDTPVVISKNRSRLSGRPKEQTWEMRGLMIAFHLHPNLGGGDFGVFQTVFGNTVPSETMRSWLRKENIYKWIDLVQVANKEDVMRIVPESKRFLFQKGDNSSRLSEKILCKYVTKASSLSSKYVQKQLVFKTALVSAQKAAAMAKKDNMKIFSSSKRQRLPAAGVETLKNLGRPVKYPDQAEFAEKLIRSRFDHGDPVTFEQVLSSFRREFSCPVKFKYFQAVVQNDHCLRVWLRRLLDRISFSERAGTISQKVPLNWLNVARTTTARIRTTALQNEIDNVVNMDETFLQFYSSDRLLVPTGTKRVGTLVPVENEKKGVTVAVSASLLASRLLPPFIIDTGVFGADLMKHWSHYNKSKILFNSTHWMTHYVFILYLTWISNTFPDSKTLLIVDRSTTHFGPLITEWLENNHSSTGGKVWIEYIPEGMTSILQVCDIAINKPLKAHVHKAYFDFRLQAIQNLTAKQLAGSVFTVPRENLFEMIENAFELINQQNYRRRWIADAFEKCGQNPWVEGDSKFEAHLASLNENCVYQHMKEGNQTLKLF